MTEQRLKRTYLDKEAHEILVSWCKANDRTAYKVLSELVRKEFLKDGEEMGKGQQPA